MRGVLLLSLLALGAAGCGGSKPASPGDEFVATESDFAGFQSWLSTPVTDTTGLSGLIYPQGPQVGFVNRPLAADATAYPSGSIIVKAVERDGGPSEWEIFAMAKRGGSYNPSGAVGWEFFLLVDDADGTTHIASRGLEPADDGHDMGTPGGYFQGGQIVPCNICHGQGRFAGTDHIISPELAPAAHP